MEYEGNKFENKILDRGKLQAAIKSAKAEGRRVVFTNGCFDIIHPGHVAYLEDAAACGDLLVVGINTDKSVKRLKGSERPINPEGDRALLLAGLGSVDFVTLFAEDTPLELINTLRPDVLVKGGDWPVEQIVGHEAVLDGGGRVFSLPFREGYSTTRIIDKIKALSARPADGRQ
jgi:rfaE bifunctional protein nucleotidyltransferase chain/domain